MKQLTRILLLAVLIITASSLAAAKTKGNKVSDEQALIALDKEWTAAELRLNDADRKTIDRIVAANYTGTSPFGQVQNKAQYMAAVEHTTDTDTADEYHVDFFDGGKLAVMTHRGTVNGKATYRSTHVWAKKGDSWQLIQNHVSNIGEPPPGDEQALLQMEKDWSDASKRQDTGWMERNYADSYTWTSPDGNINDRKTDIAESAVVTFESFEIFDMRVSVSGDTGVVTGVSTLKGKFKNQDISGKYRFTDTFVRRGGRWVILASQSTRIAPQQASVK
jgi:ketosteroid isomerase-like protein